MPANPGTQRSASHARRRAAVMLLLLAALLGTAGVRLFVGHRTFTWPPDGNLLTTVGRFLQLWHTDITTGGILDLRFTRLVAAITVGSALAASGVALQALLRNPLAEPFILGLSSGAGVGVTVQALVLYWISQSVGGPSHLGALAGAGVCMAIVYFASRRAGVLDPLGLLLTGVVLGSINGALIMFLNRMVGPGMLREDLMTWMMGYLNDWVGSGTILTVLAVTLGGIAMLVVSSRAMDAATFSDAEAIAMGVRLGALRTVLFVVSSVLAAGAVVLAGPVAFVGLICPHLARWMLGPSHRALVIASAMLGGMLIVWADIAAHGLDAMYQWGLMPIGVFTALIGGPAFLVMLRPQLGRGYPGT